MSATGFINPTLAVNACFAVTVAGESRRTILDLRAHPGLAPWLLSILDYVLYSQGRLAGERHIAEPPGGDTRQRLVDGGVILAVPRPDGVLALQLNPEFGLELQVLTRRRDAPAVRTMLPLAEDVELSRWLLAGYSPSVPAGGYLAKRPPAWAGSPTATLEASLRRYGVLIDQAPPGEAWFQDPDLPVDLAAELASAARVYPQAAGAPIPADVRRLLGRHVPMLPPDAALAWGQDAGTGMVFPTRLVAGQPLPPELGGPAAAPRAAFWERQRETARLSLRTRRYAALREILPPAQRDKLRRYVRQLADRGYFPALGDGQVELRSAIHNEPTVAALHEGLAGIVNSICAEPVIASYCYLGCYEAGAVLARHKDRKQCAYNLSLVLDMQGPGGDPEPWPIWLELDGQPEAVHLQVGDGLCYSGTDIWHWRDALPPGQRAIVCFYHFVPRGFTGSLD